MMQNNTNLTLSEWIDRMLAKRGLEKADGRNIYQYRISDEEFRDLEEFLRAYIALGQSHLGFAWLAKRPAFPRLFVLYGAEWWRRRYDGSGFSWDGILSDLNANDDEWNQTQRSECVKRGLQAWRLPILAGTGFKYLGSIAVQGGLPMKTLAEAHGKINYLLGRVLRSANNRLVDPNEIQSWIEDWQTLLPKSYRQPAIFILLADIAWTVLTLKQKAKLDSSENAIAQLDAKIPGWREQFPLPIEDNQARSLIEKLVREAASVRLPKSTVCLPVERFLEKSADGEWNLTSSIVLSDTIDEAKLAQLFNSAPEDLPRSGELSVTAGEKTRTAVIRKLAGNSSFRIEGATWGFSNEAAAREHLLRFASGDGRVWHVAAMKGHPLENDLPWIFSDDNGIFRFANQGTTKIAENEALIALPSGWQISGETDDENLKIGRLEDFSRELYRVTKTISLENSNGALCRVSLHSAEEIAESYEWRGRRWWLDFLSPTVAFRGKPNLYRVDETGAAVKISGAVNCAVIGAPESNRSIGPVKMSHLLNSELKYQSRMAILPEEADFTLQFGDAISGAIIFKNWELTNAVVKSPNINYRPEIKSNSLILHLAVAPEHRAPDYLTIELFWRHTTTPVRLNLPFPSKGARAFDASGKEMANDSMLAINRLLGVRLSVLTGGATKKIRLKLQTAGGSSARKYQLQSLPGTVNLEVKLSDYLTDINHLLSLDDSPDSKVKLSVSIEDAETFALHIARYESVIERAEDCLKICVDERVENSSAADFSVLAMRLADAHEEPSELVMSGEIENGKASWLFAPAERKAGAWLIYPGAESNVAFRPTLWTVFGETDDATSELARAIGLADENERKKAFDDLIRELAENYAHPAWEEIVRLAELVGHLPLTTLDIWRRFSRSASAMAALAFRYGKLPNGFVSRFEKELPFSWEVIPFSTWKKTIRKSFEYCENLFGTETGKIIFETHAQRRINILIARHGGLTFLLGIASMEFFPQAQRDTEQLRPAGEILGYSQLFAGEKCCLMNLRRIDRDDWVTDSDKLLEKKWASPHLQYFFHTEDYRSQNDVINFPLLLAADAAANGSASWLKNPANIHLLRTFRSFDSEWFDEAYNWTIARCLAKGLLDD